MERGGRGRVHYNHGGELRFHGAIDANIFGAVLHQSQECALLHREIQRSYAVPAQLLGKQF